MTGILWYNGKAHQQSQEPGFESLSSKLCDLGCISLLL